MEIRWRSTGVLANCHRRLCSHEFLVSRATLLCGGEAKVAEAEQQGSKRAFRAHIHNTEYFSSAPADGRSPRRNHGYQYYGSGDCPSPPSTQGVTMRLAWDRPPFCSAGGGPLRIIARLGRSYRLPGAGRTESGRCAPPGTPQSPHRRVPRLRAGATAFLRTPLPTVFLGKHTLQIPSCSASYVLNSNFCATMHGLRRV